MGSAQKINHPDILGKECFFDNDEIIVSKTNLKGHLTYVNRTFMNVSGYDEEELLSQPHSMIRHPYMPRCVFKLLWDRVQSKREVFAYVINRTKDDNYYWVFAHVTPSINAVGEVEGYHSNRRVPRRDILENTILPLYDQLLKEERSHQNKKDGMNHAHNVLLETLKDKGMTYDEFLFSLSN